METEIQIFNGYYCKQHTPWLIGAKLTLTLTATAWLEKNENTGSDIIGYWIKCMAYALEGFRALKLYCN